VWYLSDMRTFSLALCTTLVACSGDVFRPKLVEIEDTFSSTAGVAIQRTEFSYADDELESIVRTEGTDLIDARFFFYTDGWVDTVEVENAGSEFVAAHHFRYRDGRVSRLERRDAVFFGDPTQTPGERRQISQITYGQHGVSAIDFTLSSLQDANTETVEVWQERYRYDDLGRIERISYERPGGVRIHELTYNEDTGLLNWYKTRVGGTTRSVQYDYEDSGRLQRVLVDSDYYVFGYDGDLVQEIIYTSGDLIVTTRYTYGDGSTRGITPIPQIPHGELFDLKGLHVDQLDFATFGVLQ
jgi:hypothetical protein